jgi:hypothetical protein
LEWILLTSIPTERFEEASQRIGWYRRRWTAKDRKRWNGFCLLRSQQSVLKRLLNELGGIVDDGRLRITTKDSKRVEKREQRQLQDYQSLRRLLGLIAPLAVRLLQIRSASRENPDMLAWAILPSEVVRVVAFKAEVPPEHLTVQQCWYTKALAGGYLARHGDGPPGWKTLWLGWFYFQTLIEGLHIASLLE